MQWQTFDVELQDKVALVRFNRADKANALNQTMWQELQSVMEWADAEPAVRAVVLAGQGRHFCSGIDLSMLLGIQGAIADECEGRQREKLRRLILQLQDNVSSLERCRKPVVAAIHGACLGGGLDIALAADFPLCRSRCGVWRARGGYRHGGGCGYAAAFAWCGRAGHGQGDGADRA
jgi:enoyl-CoA hydratase